MHESAISDWLADEIKEIYRNLPRLGKGKNSMSTCKGLHCQMKFKTALIKLITQLFVEHNLSSMLWFCQTFFLFSNFMVQCDFNFSWMSSLGTPCLKDFLLRLSFCKSCIQRLSRWEVINMLQNSKSNICKVGFL